MHFHNWVKRTGLHFEQFPPDSTVIQSSGFVAGEAVRSLAPMIFSRELLLFQAECFVRIVTGTFPFNF